MQLSVRSHNPLGKLGYVQYVNGNGTQAMATQVATLFYHVRHHIIEEPILNKDQVYGAVVLVISFAIAAAYLVSLFAPYLALPSWLAWWAIALPVILAVLALLTICMWIGWVMLTTPPPEFEKPVSKPVESKNKENKA